MSDADPTQDEREERYKTKNDKTGLFRTNLWIPRNLTEWYKNRAAKDRAAHRKELGLEK